jgi:DNA-binding response OmpR family regulator
MTSNIPTVLVVEDEESLVNIYEKWLEDEYDVRTATSGDAALAQLDSQVDVVLLDRLMPGMSGDEVLAEIRDRTDECRVAMVTAVEPDFDILQMGFDDYLTKPVEREELQGTVERLLARGSFAQLERELYSLVSKQAALQSSKSVNHLENNEEYQRLRERVEALREELDVALPEFGSSDFIAMMRELEDREHAGDRPGGDGP